jgi:RNA polymerase-binding transcription factor DksA
MSKAELLSFRRLLEQRRDFRLAQLAQLRRLDERALLRGVDREVNDRLIRAARTALHDLQDALSRMDAGKYGTCRGCGGSVERERLQIVPQVALCASCQRTAAPAPADRG